MTQDLEWCIQMEDDLTHQYHIVSGMRSLAIRGRDVLSILVLAFPDLCQIPSTVPTTIHLV